MKTNQKLVFIIFPTNNKKKFIKQSSKSVLSNTYGNLKLIFTDASSKDNF